MNYCSVALFSFSDDLIFESNSSNPATATYDCFHLSFFCLHKWSPKLAACLIFRLVRAEHSCWKSAVDVLWQCFISSNWMWLCLIFVMLEYHCTTTKQCRSYRFPTNASEAGCLTSNICSPYFIYRQVEKCDFCII